MVDTGDLPQKDPWYESKKFLAFALVCVLLLVCLFVKAPVEVTSKLAEAITFGLPALLVAQAHVDAKRAAPGGGG